MKFYLQLRLFMPGVRTYGGNTKSTMWQRLLLVLSFFLLNRDNWNSSFVQLRCEHKAAYNTPKQAKPPRGHPFKDFSRVCRVIWGHLPPGTVNENSCSHIMYLSPYDKRRNCYPQMLKVVWCPLNGWPPKTAASFGSTRRGIIVSFLPTMKNNLMVKLVTLL